MERYTEKVDGIWSVSCKYEEPPYPVVTQEVIDRLAAYEDTGLEPEEVAKIREDVENGYMKSTARRYGISVARLRELVQADREGRCVVLKFAPGSKIYRVWFNPSNGKLFVTEHIMKSKEMCLKAELWNDAYKTKEEAEKALEEMEKNENG